MVGRIGGTMSELALETLLEATMFGSGKSLSVKELSESLSVIMQKKCKVQRK